MKTNRNDAKAALETLLDNLYYPKAGSDRAEIARLKAIVLEAIDYNATIKRLAKEELERRGRCF